MKFSKAFIVALILALVMCSPMAAFASSAQTVGVTVSLDKTSVRPGESVTLSFSFDQKVEDVSSFSFYVVYDESLFTYDKEVSAMPAEYYEGCNQNPYTVAYLEKTPKDGIAEFGFAHVSTSASAFDGSDDYAAGVFYNMVFVAADDIEGSAEAHFDFNWRGTAMMTYVLEDGNLVSITREAVMTVNGVEAGKSGDANSKTVEISAETGGDTGGSGSGTGSSEGSGTSGGNDPVGGNAGGSGESSGNGSGSGTADGGGSGSDAANDSGSASSETGKDPEPADAGESAAKPGGSGSADKDAGEDVSSEDAQGRKALGPYALYFAGGAILLITALVILTRRAKKKRS